MMGLVRSPTSFALLDALDDEERRLVLAEARRRRFARNEVIFLAGSVSVPVSLSA